jgi:hypothetical protein
MVETHSQLDIVAIEEDNQMAIIQIQVGKNIVENVLLNGGASVNIIIKNLRTKLGLPKPRPIPYYFKNGKSEYDQAFKNHQKFEDSHTWYTICSHIYCFAKQCGKFYSFHVLGRP